MGAVCAALSAHGKVWLVRMRCAWFNCNAYAREEYMCPRRNFNHSAPKALVEFACEYLCIAYNEGMLVLSPHCLEDDDDFRKEIVGHTYCE